MLLSILTAVAGFFSWLTGFDVEPDIAGWVIVIILTMIHGILANIFV